MPGNVLILPHQGAFARRPDCGYADRHEVARISDWLQAKIHGIRDVWVRRASIASRPAAHDVQGCVEQLIRVLLHRRFNHQSRGRHESILPAVRRTIASRAVSGRPITFFLLYNGGYRATPFPENDDLIFQPDQTELMLLHQISLLQERVIEVYEPGIEFTIVINNGVASWVNDTPIEKTEAYASRFREMIREVGADGRVVLLVQSEMPGFRRHLPVLPCPTSPGISRKEHVIVERFLGRSCSEEEARRRIALYACAEAAWAEHLRPVTASQGAILLRQVAHPDMLSFRPFPGGAIRVQNGSLGFLARDGALLPTLVTSESFKRHDIRIMTIERPLTTCRKPGCSPEPVDA